MVVSTRAIPVPWYGTTAELEVVVDSIGSRVSYLLYQRHAQLSLEPVVFVGRSMPLTPRKRRTGPTADIPLSTQPLAELRAARVASELRRTL